MQTSLGMTRGAAEVANAVSWTAAGLSFEPPGGFTGRWRRTGPQSQQDPGVQGRRRSGQGPVRHLKPAQVQCMRTGGERQATGSRAFNSE